MTLPSGSLSLGTINYVLFPITTILRQNHPSELPDNFLEGAFRVLSHIVWSWRELEGGIDIGAWEQLWRFTAATVGPRVAQEDDRGRDGSGKGIQGKGKGKAKEIGQEVQLEAVNLLTALLRPSDPGVENGGPAHPRPEMEDRYANAKSPLMPTLFQTITLLLATSSPTTPYLPLQLSSLKLLGLLVSDYFKGKHEVLASVLPGTISAMAKLVSSEGRGMKGDVAAEIAALVQAVIIETLSDGDLRDLGVLRPKVDDLSQFTQEIDEIAPEPPSPAPSSSSTNPTPTPFPPLTASYLSFTSTQLQSTIPPILSFLSQHPSHLARQAASELAYHLLARCYDSLALLVSHNLTALLNLSMDAFDPVRHEARRNIRKVLALDERLALESALVDLLGNTVNSLPRLITSQQDAKVTTAAKLITALAELTSELSSMDKTRRNPIAELLGPAGNVERWGMSLLNCLEFGRPAGWGATGGGSANMAKALHQHSTLPVPLLLEGADNTPSTFPQLPFRHVESESTGRAISGMLRALGSAGGEKALHSVEHFLLFAKANRNRNVSAAVSAIWVANMLLDGIATAQIGGPEGRIGKATRKMAREATRIVVAMDDEVDAEDDDDISLGQETSAALLPVERTKGFDTVITLLDKKPLPDSHTASTTRQLHRAAQRALLTCQSLSLLSTTSRILSSSFRPLLLTVLYTILSHLGSPQDLVVQYAETALAQVAYNTAYASVQNLILDNVDYVINIVSQRLTYRRLSSQAPLVLISMIRLVGDEIVPLVHDVVDEIFDALDDYHGYEVLASTLLAVLVTLIEVMAVEVKSNGVSDARREKLEELRRIDQPPDPERDFAKFHVWYEEREERNKQEIESILERAPQRPWVKEGKKESSENDMDQDPEDAEEQPPPPDETAPPPTRSQEVTMQILSKSLYFLTHPSPFLRSRILSLITHAIPILASANREGDLLPLIDRSWGTIMNRLDDPEPHVVTEAAEVIASLCDQVGDFMSRRVLDHCWPKFKRLLEDQARLDAKSALARRGAIGTHTSYSVSHRLHMAILRVGVFIAEEVPVNEGVLWEMMLAFRACLNDRAHEEMQQGGLALYRALGRRDGDALWVLLMASMGRLEGDTVWGWLEDATLQIGKNAERLLEEI